MKVKLELYGLPSQTIEAEFIRQEGNIAILRGYLGDEERYSLDTGKNLDTYWDFWRISTKDRQKIKALQEVAK